MGAALVSPIWHCAWKLQGGLQITSASGTGQGHQTHPFAIKIIVRPLENWIGYSSRWAPKTSPENGLKTKTMVPFVNRNVLVFRAQNEYHFLLEFHFFRVNRFQATACWQWANCLASLRPPEKRLVHVNMDETCMRLWLPARKGYVHLPPGSRKRHILDAERRSDLSKRRSAMSLLAFVSDDAVVQAALPQVLVANKHVLSVRDHEQLGGLIRADSIFILRRESAWATVDLLVEIFRLVAKCLEDCLRTCHILFSMDACPVHMTPRVVRAVAAAGLFLHFVPAGMTAWLQPLDAYCFSALKTAVRQGYEQRLLQSETGDVETCQMCQIICKAVTLVLLGKSWTHAFRGCGFGGDQSFLGGRVRRRLDWPGGPPPVSSDLPSLRQLQHVFIQGRQIPIGWLFNLCQDSKTRASTPEPLARSALEDEPMPHVWHARLRSSSLVDERSAATTASSSSFGAHPRQPPAVPCPPPALALLVPAARVPRAQRLALPPARPPLPPPAPVPRPRRLGAPRSSWHRDA